MLQSSGNSSGKIDLFGQINRAWRKDFIFDNESTAGVITDVDVTTSTWEFFIKRYKGDKNKTLSLILASGLSFPIYTTNTVRVDFTAVQSRVEEGKYYFELYNITETKTKVSGEFEFTYDPHE